MAGKFRLHGIERRIFHFCSRPLFRCGRGRPVDGRSGSEKGAEVQEHIVNINRVGPAEIGPSPARRVSSLEHEKADIRAQRARV